MIACASGQDTDQTSSVEQTVKFSEGQVYEEAINTGEYKPDEKSQKKVYEVIYDA